MRKSHSIDGNDFHNDQRSHKYCEWSITHGDLAEWRMYNWTIEQLSKSNIQPYENKMGRSYCMQLKKKRRKLHTDDFILVGLLEHQLDETAAHVPSHQSQSERKSVRLWKRSTDPIVRQSHSYPLLSPSRTSTVRFPRVRRQRNWSWLACTRALHVSHDGLWWPATCTLNPAAIAATCANLARHCRLWVHFARRVSISSVTFERNSRPIYPLE